MPATAQPAELDRLLALTHGAVGLAARHVESGREWRYHDRQPFPSASLIKLPVLAAFWEAVGRGAIDPAQRIPVPAAARVEGTGVLKALAPGLAPTWQDLATLMITVSDNVATNLLVDRLGIGAIQAWIDAAGLTETRLQRRMMDLDAAATGRDNWTSAADTLELLARIHAGRCVSPEVSARILRVLEAQQLQEKLGRRLPAEARLANKTGNIADVSHDAGVITWPGGTLIVAILTRGVEPVWRAADLIAEAAVLLLAECQRRDQASKPQAVGDDASGGADGG